MQGALGFAELVSQSWLLCFPWIGERCEQFRGLLLFSLKIFKFIYSLLERENEGEREGKKYQGARDSRAGCLLLARNWGPPATQACALTGNWTGNW